MVSIIKANGEKEKFKKSKIFGSVLRAGASRREARELAESIQKRVREGMPTKEILRICLSELRDNPSVQTRYNLKQAIMKLGPQGFTFEEFFSQVLRNYGYATKTNVLLKGKAVFQEVDILAKKDVYDGQENGHCSKTFMIEMKYHNKPGITTDTKVAMYTHARFLDILNNKKIDAGWLVTNTRCTTQAIKYAKSVGLKVTTWDYPRTKQNPKQLSETTLNLQDMIQKKFLYPITIFKSVNGKTREVLLKEKIVLAKDLANYESEKLVSCTGLKLGIVKKILKEAKEFVKLNLY